MFNISFHKQKKKRKNVNGLSTEGRIVMFLSLQKNKNIKTKTQNYFNYFKMIIVG